MTGTDIYFDIYIHIKKISQEMFNRNKLDIFGSTVQMGKKPRNLNAIREISSSYNVILRGSSYNVILCSVHWSDLSLELLFCLIFPSKPDYQFVCFNVFICPLIMTLLDFSFMILCGCSLIFCVAFLIDLTL